MARARPRAPRRAARAGRAGRLRSRAAGPESTRALAPSRGSRRGSVSPPRLSTGRAALKHELPLARESGARVPCAGRAANSSKNFPSAPTVSLESNSSRAVSPLALLLSVLPHGSSPWIRFPRRSNLAAPSSVRRPAHRASARRCSIRCAPSSRARRPLVPVRTIRLRVPRSRPRVRASSARATRPSIRCSSSDSSGASPGTSRTSDGALEGIHFELALPLPRLSELRRDHRVHPLVPLPFPCLPPRAETLRAHRRHSIGQRAIGASRPRHWSGRAARRRTRAARSRPTARRNSARSPIGFPCASRPRS